MPKQHHARGYYRPQTIRFYIARQDKSCCGIDEDGDIINTLALDNLADAQPILDEIKQHSLVACDGVIYTYRIRRDKPATAKPMSNRYANLRKRTAKAYAERNFIDSLNQHLYGQEIIYIDFEHKTSDGRIVTGYHNLVNNRIVPSSDIFDFAGKIREIIRKEGN
jgi:hypothetical protein